MSERFTAQEMRNILNQSWHDTSRETVHDIIRQAADTEEERKRLKAELSDAKKRLRAGFAQCDKEVAKLNPNGNIDTRLMDEARIGRIRQALKGEEVVG